MASVPLSLYLDLEEGQAADIEVVSRAALAWAAAIREMAYNIDPSLEIRIELTSGTQGSLSLNSLIKSIKKAKDEPVTLGALVVLGFLWFGAELAHDAGHRVIELLLGEETQKVELSKDQVQQIGTAVAKAVNGKVADPQIKQVYRELERDPAIKGVGVSRTPGVRPERIVPKAEFPARAGRSANQVVEQTVRHRTESNRITVVLVRAILLPGDRLWGFRGPTGEFGAKIKDKDFLDRTLAGTTAVPLMGGIEMDIELEVKEEFQGGVWTAKDLSVTHVFGLRRPPMTGDLFAPSPKPNQPPGGDDDDERS